MKGIRITEILSEIRANLVAFISIAMFVCLGVAMFLGVTWASDALRGHVEETMEAGAMHDLEVQYLYGITDANLERLRQTEGVSDVEPGYICYVRMIDGSKRPVLKMQGLTERIDLATLTEGALPTKSGEVALLAFYAEEHGLHVGDTIKLEHDNDDKDDADGIEYLNTDTLTVTGLVDHPSFLSKVPGTLGGATVGSGDVDCTAFVTEDIFDKSMFDDAYPVVYLRSDSLRGKITFEKPYKKALAPLTESVTALGDGLADERYQEILDLYDAKLAEAEKKIKEGEDALADGEKEYASGKKEIDEGEKKISSGEAELADGEKKLDDAKRQLDEGSEELDEALGELEEGEREVAEGEEELAEGRERAESEQEDAEAELAAAKKKLDAAQKEYDANEQDYADAKENYDDASKTLDSVSDEYDAALESHKALKGDLGPLESAIAAFQEAADAYHAVDGDAAATDDDKDAAWAKVEEAYPALADACDSTETDLTSLADNMGVVVEAYEVPAPEVPKHDTIAELQRDNTDKVLETAKSEQSAANDVLNDLDTINVDANDRTYNILELRVALKDADEALKSSRKDLDDAKKKLADGRARYNEARENYDDAVAEVEERLSDAEQELEAGKAELAEGWAAYDDARREFDQSLAEYNEALQTFKEKKAELEQGKVDLEKGRAELKDARKTLEEKREELKNAKASLENARADLKGAVNYDWIVMSRLENGGGKTVDTIVTTLSRVRLALALIFVLLGLFVCYTVVSRLVHDQTVQSGTKKAMGFRSGEIAFLYLCFSGAAVVIGVALGALIAVYIIQPIMNPASADSLALSDFKPSFSWGDLLLMGAIELALVLVCTWLAIRKLLSENAVELLAGGRVKEAKALFFEKWKVWAKVPLFAQIIVKNCVSDVRRVIATLVGVAGCTALIVTSITLWGNVRKSIDRQYNAIYHFDTIVYLDNDVDTAIGSVGAALEKEGVANCPVRRDKIQVPEKDGYRTVVPLMVPQDEQAFESFYNVLAAKGDNEGQDVDLSQGGVWISSSYADHMKVKPGDEIEVTEADGTTRSLKVAGVFEYYLLQHEFVMDPGTYRVVFGHDADPNVLLARSDGADLDQLRTKLLDVPGYNTLVEDYKLNSFAFDELASLLTVVVIIYLVLAILMALVVLLNLDSMFVDEKKRELIVLMINGFSMSSAKAYIYNDSIVLSVIGILLGILFGWWIGDLTVGALEPMNGFFFKGFNVVAAIIGVLGAGVLAAIMLIIALRKIPKLDLTDINRF